MDNYEIGAPQIIEIHLLILQTLMVEEDLKLERIKIVQDIQHLQIVTSIRELIMEMRTHITQNILVIHSKYHSIV